GSPGGGRSPGGGVGEWVAPRALGAGGLQPWGVRAPPPAFLEDAAHPPQERAPSPAPIASRGLVPLRATLRALPSSVVMPAAGGSAHRHELLPGALDEWQLGSQAGRLGRCERLLKRVLGSWHLAGSVAGEERFA